MDSVFLAQCLEIYRDHRLIPRADPAFPILLQEDQLGILTGTIQELHSQDTAMMDRTIQEAEHAKLRFGLIKAFQGLQSVRRSTSK